MLKFNEIWECSSVTKCMLSLCEALSSNCSTKRKQPRKLTVSILNKSLTMQLRSTKLGIDSYLMTFTRDETTYAGKIEHWIFFLILNLSNCALCLQHISNRRNCKDKYPPLYSFPIVKTWVCVCVCAQLSFILYMEFNVFWAFPDFIKFFISITWMTLYYHIVWLYCN